MTRPLHDRGKFFVLSNIVSEEPIDHLYGASSQSFTSSNNGIGL